MGKGKNRQVKAEPAEEATATDGAVAAKRTSKTLEQMQADYAEDPDGTLRKASHHYARKLTGMNSMTWVEFCDLKIKLFTKAWEEKKTKPGSQRAIKILTPEDLAKKKAALEKAQKRAMRLMAAITAAEAK